MIFKPDFPQDVASWHLITKEQAALFMGVGLGKTATGLLSLEHLYDDKVMRGALIVAPMRVSTLTWPNERDRWDNFSWMPMANLRTENGWEALERGNSLLYTINYEMLPKLCEKFLLGRKKSLPFDTVIFDELTRAKSHKSTRINRFREYTHKIPRRWGFTGTPAPNSLMELFAQIRLLDDGKALGHEFSTFRECYFEAKDYQGYKWEPLDGAKERIYTRLKGIALTLKTSDYLDIPDTIVNVIEVPMPDNAWQLYKELREEYFVRISKDEYILADNAAVVVSKLLQIAGGAVYANETKEVKEIHNAKIIALQKLVKQINAPVLIACNFIHERNRILKAIPGCVEWKDSLLDQWNNKKISAIVADPRSIGEGLNLQDGGNNIIWFSPTYSRGNYDQYNGRIARRGQKLTPIVWRILCPGTMDDAVVEVLEKKSSEQGALLEALINFQKLLPYF